jgi:plasmid stability protein
MLLALFVPHWVRPKTPGNQPAAKGSVARSVSLVKIGSRWTDRLKSMGLRIPSENQRGAVWMPVNLSIKKVPDDVARALRYRAAANQRSLQEELLDILKQAAKDQGPVTIDGLLSSAQRKKPALDEAASKVRLKQEAEQERVAQRFQDLWARPDDAGPGKESGGKD